MRVILTLFVLISLSTNAQEQTLKVTYVNFNDSIIPDDKKYTTTLLMLNERSVSYQVPYEFKGAGMYFAEERNGIRKYEYYTDRDTVKLYVFKDLRLSELYFQPRIGLGSEWKKIFLDSLHSFYWKVEKNEKKIGAQMCKKATTFFRGRTYTAWFSESIPISNGPWKFGGLPGLILEVYDESFAVYWTLLKFEYTNDPLPVFPENISESFVHYKQIYREYYNKLKASIESSDGVSNTNCSGCKSTMKTVKEASIERLID